MVATYNNIATNLGLTDIIRKIFTIYTLKGNVMALITWSDWQLNR